MKSSRTRFAEFRDKIRKGLLDSERLRDPADTREDRPYTGRHHDGPPPGKHQFKHDKHRLFHEYRVMLRGYYAPVALLLLYSIFGAVLAPIAPLGLRILVDDIAPGHSLQDSRILQFTRFPRHLLPNTPLSSLYALVAVLAITAFLGIALDWLRLFAQQRVNYKLNGSLRQRLHEHLSKLSLAQLAEYKTGGIVSRIMGDSEQVVGGIQNALVNPFNAAVRLLALLFIIITTDWRLSVGAAAFIPPIVLIHYFLFRRLRPLWRNIRDDNAALAARLTDMYGGIRVVRSFRRERTEHKEYRAAQDTMIRKQQYTAILGRFLSTGWNTFGPAIGIFIIWFGGIKLLHHETTIGTLMMYQLLIFQLISPITQVIDSLQHLQQNLGALDRVVDVLDQPIDMPDRPNAHHARRALGHIELRDVTFAYKPEKKIIQDLSLNVPAGTTLAIVGPSGSGKTTLVNLIARFFDVQQGHILLDGKDIRDLRLEDYRKLFAMVLQDVYLFDGTVAQNIAYGRRHATMDEIIIAAKKANAHDFIAELDQGYDTVVGERGNRLSGGQKQRISIARAILADPTILILDEATSSLDTASEHLIQTSLNDLMQDRTTFVIAHRLSTIMHADHIVVLVEGRILEQGTHEELLDLRGFYHTMFTQQFQRHRDPTLERIEWESPPLAPQCAQEPRA